MKQITILILMILFSSNAEAFDLKHVFDNSQAKQINNNDCWELRNSKETYVSIKLLMENIVYGYGIEKIKVIEHNDKIILLQCGDWRWSKAYAYSLTEEQFIKQVKKTVERLRKLQQEHQNAKNNKFNSILDSIEK